MPPIDHLVYCVPNLAAVAAALGQRLGAPFTPGGRHPAFGTHNALLRLGEGCYLELLAVDPATAVPAPRWMGVDLVTEPRLTRVALRPDDFPAAVQALAARRPALAAVVSGQRQRPDGSWLRWQLTRPLPRPAVEAVPFLIDWSASAFHPADRLPDRGCRLQSLRLFTAGGREISGWGGVGKGEAFAPAAGPWVWRATVIGPTGVVVLE